MLGEQMVEQVCARTPATVCIGLSDLLDGGEGCLHTDLMGVMHMCCGSTASVRRVDLLHLSLGLPHVPQRMQRVVRAMEESRDGVQRLGGRLAVAQYDADEQRQDQCALVVAPAATSAVGELVLLMLVVGILFDTICLVLTSSRQMLGPVGVVILLLWPACPISTAASSGFLGGESRVVCVL